VLTKCNYNWGLYLSLISEDTGNNLVRRLAKLHLSTHIQWWSSKFIKQLVSAKVAGNKPCGHGNGLKTVVRDHPSQDYLVFSDAPMSFISRKRASSTKWIRGFGRPQNNLVVAKKYGLNASSSNWTPAFLPVVLLFTEWRITCPYRKRTPKIIIIIIIIIICRK
jgi:hypothetical protein